MDAALEDCTIDHIDIKDSPMKGLEPKTLGSSTEVGHSLLTMKITLKDLLMLEAFDPIHSVLNSKKNANEEAQRIISLGALLINEATLAVVKSLVVAPLPYGTTLESSIDVVNSEILVEAIEKEVTLVNTLNAPTLYMVNEVIDDAMWDLDVFNPKKAVGRSSKHGSNAKVAEF